MLRNIDRGHGLLRLGPILLHSVLPQEMAQAAAVEQRFDVLHGGLLVRLVGQLGRGGVRAVDHCGEVSHGFVQLAETDVGLRADMTEGQHRIAWPTRRCG